MKRSIIAVFVIALTIFSSQGVVEGFRWEREAERQRNLLKQQHHPKYHGCIRITWHSHVHTQLVTMDSSCVAQIRGQERDQLVGQVNQLTGQLNAVQQERAQLVGQRDQLTGQRDQLAGQLNAVQQERDQLVGQRDQLTGQRDQLTGQLNAVQQERDQLVGQRDQLAGQRDQLTGRLNAVQRERDQLMGQRDAYRANRDHYRGQAHARQQEIDQFRGEFKTLNDRLGHLRGEVTAINNSRVALENAVGQLRTEHQKKTEQLNTRQNEVGQVNQTLVQLRGQIGHLTDQVGEINNKIGALTNTRGSLENTVGQLRTEHQKKTEQLNTTRQESEQIKARAGQFMEKLHGRSEQLNVERYQLGQLKGKLDRQSERLDVERQRLERLTEEQCRRIVTTASKVATSNIVRGVASTANARPYKFPEFSLKPQQPDAGYAPYFVSFAAKADLRGVSRRFNYTWDFGDGTVVNGRKVVTHIYHKVGTYTVTLTVDDGIGGTSTHNTIVNVVEAPPLVVESFRTFTSNTHNRSPLVVVTRPIVTGGNPRADRVTSYQWTINGSPVKKAHNNLVYTFTAPGTYKIEVKANTKTGRQVVGGFDLVVSENQPPKCDIVYKDSPRHNHTKITPRCVDPDGRIVGYNWDLGNGTTSKKNIVFPRYRESGTYKVTLTATDDSGATAIFNKDVNVRR